MKSTPCDAIDSYTTEQLHGFNCHSIHCQNNLLILFMNDRQYKVADFIKQIDQVETLTGGYLPLGLNIDQFIKIF